MHIGILQGIRRATEDHGGEVGREPPFARADRAGDEVGVGEAVARKRTAKQREGVVSGEGHVALAFQVAPRPASTESESPQNQRRRILGPS